MTAITKTQILTTALTLLWDGHGKRQLGKEFFGCFSITRAFHRLAGVEWTEARHNEEVKAIHTRIIQYIDGCASVGGYFGKKYGRCLVENVEKQAFRKKMLEDILAEYEKKALLTRQIEVLEQVKAERVSGEDHRIYVCDHVYAVARVDRSVAVVITGDISTFINGEFGVEEYLGLPSISFTDPVTHAYRADGGVTEEAKEFRLKMIDTLIQRYQAQLEAV